MTAISVSERLLEMAAFYTWLDFTLTDLRSSPYRGQSDFPDRGKEKSEDPFHEKHLHLKK